MAKDNTYFHRNRRTFLKGFSFAVGTTMLGVPLFSMQGCQSSNPTSPESKTSSTGAPAKKKLGIALVGLGSYSKHQLAPALQETEHCYLAGIVTGTPSKLPEWQSKYNIPDKNVYNYENFDSIAQNPDIDIIYIVLPNGLHAEYTIRAAKAKKNIICEKPMATSVEDAEHMLQACQENGVLLSIGYRLHFEPFNKRVMELGQKQVYGKVKHIEAKDAFDITSNSPDIWRLDQKLSGGGPLMDLGIYCVQGAIYTIGKPPIAVTAKFGEKTKPTYFDDVEETIEWQLEFEGGVTADCMTSYTKKADLLSGTAENGWWRVQPAFTYEGKKGETKDGPMPFENTYEQVHQMDAQALSFKNNQPSIVPGEMGLRDVKILMAIYESARANGKRVELDV